MPDKQRYLLVLEVETDIELDKDEQPSSNPRWRLFDIYPNITSENYPAGDYELDLVEICSVKNMGSAD